MVGNIFDVFDNLGLKVALRCRGSNPCHSDFQPDAMTPQPRHGSVTETITHSTPSHLRLAQIKPATFGVSSVL